MEATARLDTLSSRPAGEAAWHSALAVTDNEEAFAATGGRESPAAVACFLTTDADHPGSIVRCVETAINGPPSSRRYRR